MNTLSLLLSVHDIDGDIVYFLGFNYSWNFQVYFSKVGFEGPDLIYVYKELQNFSLVFYHVLLF